MLAWLVDGAVRWYAGEPGRPARTMGQPPERVRRDVAAWRETCDLIYAFIIDALEFDPDSHVVSEELIAAFNIRIRARGHRDWSAELFAARFEVHSECREHGVTKARIRAGRPGLSRPPGYAQQGLGDQYTAWFGMRFGTSTNEKPQVVQGAQGSNNDRYIDPSREEFMSAPAHPAQAKSDWSSEADWWALWRSADHAAAARWSDAQAGLS